MTKQNNEPHFSDQIHRLSVTTTRLSQIPRKEKGLTSYDGREYTRREYGEIQEQQVGDGVRGAAQDLLTHMSDICDFIDQMASPALSLLPSLTFEHKHNTIDGPGEAPPEAILIHCDLGISRSPTIIIAYLMRKFCMQQAEVLEFVQSKQRIEPSPNFTRQLQVWEEVRYQVWEDEDKTVPKAPYKAYMEDRAALLEKRGLTGNEPLAPQNL
ncbi:dual specificity phosphatase Yvh1 [Penicillium herquei]|nr:dual specificity phosphatase Yvh1 [Penicillium herquei]